LTPKVHCGKLQKFWIIPKVTKAKIAMLAKRPTHATCLMVMVHNNVANKTADYAFTDGSGFIGSWVFCLG
jgi:hypothetical protein